MSCSKPLPPFTFDLLCYLNRDQLERFSIVCRPLKNFIDRYFHSKPYRVFDELRIRRGCYALIQNGVQWHPNRDDYTAQQFLTGQDCIIDIPYRNGFTYYSFAEMRPYLGPTIRIKWTIIFVARDSIYNSNHIAEMESIAYLWRNDKISVYNAGITIPNDRNTRIIAEDFQLILNSPTILQCRYLKMYKADFSFKDYKVLHTVNVLELHYDDKYEIDPRYCPEFLEQLGVKPVVAFLYLRRADIDKLLDRLSKAFCSAVLPNAFKIVFAYCNDPMTEFQETNTTSGEKLDLKKGLPVECQKYLGDHGNYTLERSSI
ncbi:hypothetical protein Ddc_11114 [Ditylenchus destructor]|nr:hypothetical protein Ddc_11114 [Ditylenchus destructor]